MRRSREQGIGGRAAIAVIALYALVLQAFVAGMIPHGGVHHAGLSALCAPAADQDGEPRPQAKHDCCLAAMAAPSLPPPTASLAAPWPLRDARVVAFPTFESAPSTGPPRGPHTARGPPSA